MPKLNILSPLIGGFLDEMEKIALMDGISNSQAPIGTIKSTVPKNLSKPGNTPKYTQVNTATSTSPAASAQPMLSAPVVRA